MLRVNRRTLLLALVGVLGTAAAIVLWPQSPDNEGNDGPPLSGLPIKAGDGIWPGTYWLPIAQKKGWFAEAGLNVELVDVAPNYFDSLTDTVEGKLDTNSFALFDLVSFRLQGADLVGVLFSDDSQGIEAVVARAGIESLADLKGKRVGVDAGSYLEYILDEAARRDGVNPADITKVQMSTEKAAETLAAGQVDAVVAWEPIVSQALRVAGSHKVFDTSKFPGISPSLMVFSRHFIDKRPGDVQAFAGVWRRANAFIRDHLDEAFAIVAEARDTTLDKVREMARTDVIMSPRDNLTAFSEGAGSMSLHGRARGINGFLINKGVTERRLDTFDFLDDKFVRALQPGGTVKVTQ